MVLVQFGGLFQLPDISLHSLGGDRRGSGAALPVAQHKVNNVVVCVCHHNCGSAAVRRPVDVNRTRRMMRSIKVAKQQAANFLPNI
jgi:hypothetical protein